MKYRNLGAARKAKKDEFYTQLTDIEKELKHYKKHFRGKTVYCNCDNPFKSNFFKYFVLNFNSFGLKKLIATCYAGYERNRGKPYKAVVTKVYDATGGDMLDVAELFKSSENVLTELEADGDFRSDECLKLLEESDIVVTNPPFSLFREYFTLLIAHKKNFLIIGNMNAITYKCVFPLIKENKTWLGPSISRGDREFQVPKEYPITAAGWRVDENGNKFLRVKGVRWFTNLDPGRRRQPLPLMSMEDNIKFNKKLKGQGYQTYDNYDAIEVPYTDAIPSNYNGVMGVPISFLDKYSPEQFEIVKFRHGDDGKDLRLKDGTNPYLRILIKHKTNI